MIDLAPNIQVGITHPTFASYNQNVADILTFLVKDTNTWTWMKGSARFRNGRHMFTNLKTL